MLALLSCEGICREVSEEEAAEPRQASTAQLRDLPILKVSLNRGLSSTHMHACSFEHMLPTTCVRTHNFVRSKAEMHAGIDLSWFYLQKVELGMAQWSVR